MKVARFSVGLCLVAALALAISFRSSLVAAPPEAAAAKPVEADMHEFMEYVFQPTYLRLKPAMASEPKDRGGWKSIKADSLSLAEAGNLLLGRSPEKDDKVWDELSIAVRESGGSLYQAAKKKDYKEARQHFEAMLKKCNACHDKYAGGEHQLSP